MKVVKDERSDVPPAQPDPEEEAKSDVTPDAQSVGEMLPPEVREETVSGNFDGPGMKALAGSLKLNEQTLWEFETPWEKVRVNTYSAMKCGPPNQDAEQVQMSTSFSVLKAAIDSGKVDPRSSIGQQFTAEHKSGTPEGDAYRACNRAEAQAFRLKWAQKRYAMMEKGKSFTESWRRIDVTKGEYMNFGKMVKKRGQRLPGAHRVLEARTQVCQVGPALAAHPWADREDRILKITVRVERRVRAVLG